MRFGMVVCAAVLPVLCPQVAVLEGQTSTDKDPIVTDRPDFTEASIVVPKGSLQVENGIAWTSDHGTRTLDLTESLLRFGLSGRTEVRFGVPGFLADFGGRGSAGFGDLSIGIKQQIGPLPGGFDVAMIAAISLPTGANDKSSHGYDPFVKLPWSREMGGGWSVGGMFSAFWFTEDNRRRFMWEPTVYLERELGKRCDAFFEYGADYPTHAASRQTAHSGVAWRITPRHQVDMHAGWGLTHATPQFFLAAGYSFRLDHVFRKRW